MRSATVSTVCGTAAGVMVAAVVASVLLQEPRGRHHRDGSAGVGPTTNPDFGSTSPTTNPDFVVVAKKLCLHGKA